MVKSRLKKTFSAMTLTSECITLSASPTAMWA
jgi:hypothetical protein